ncbi:MAG TPA: hypothetical protein VJT75_12285 [Thermoleophilaceae bacterium]|nr:hypothetical protein [Thermoleophilaceae bacterium]
MLRQAAARVRALAFEFTRFIRARPSPRPLRAAAAVVLVFALAAVALLTLVTGGEEPAVTPTATAEADPSADPSESRDAYSDQSDAEALATDRDQFDGLLEEPPLEWPPDHRGQDVRGYLSENAAVVTEADGSRGVIESTLPLRGETPGGDSAPIDLSLVRAGGTSLAPRSSIAAVRIPDEATGELRFPDQDFGIKLAGAEPQDASVQSNKVFFANAVDDGDYLLEPTPAGAELSVVLRSADAPTTIPLQFELAGGQALRRTGTDDDRLPPGSIEVVDGSDRVAAAFPALAADAAGNDVPVSYELDGDRLSLHVGTNAETTYPVLVDPPVGVYDNNGTSAGSGNLDGYRWKNWRPATNTDVAGTVNPASWSFCNNQSSNPSKKFYFCQGTLTGSNVTGGAILIKPNSGQTYTTADWGQWVHEAPPGAYIYKLDATSLSNVGPAQAQLSIGVRTADGSSWEWGSVRAADGSSSPGTAASPDPNNHPYPAAYRTPTNVALSGATRYLFVHNGSGVADVTPSSPITPRNKAVLRMFMSAGTPSASPLPYTAMGGAATYESETTPPTLAPPTHTVAPQPSTWVNGYTDTVSATANDVGLGLGTITFAKGSSLIKSQNACTQTGGPVPGSTANATNVYDGCETSLDLPATTYTAPEGTSSYSIAATDLVGNHAAAQDKTWQVKVDQHPPSALDFTGGTLTGQDDQPVHGATTLDFSATDALSGVKVVKLYVDDNLVDTATPQTACDATGCPTSLPGQLSFDTEAQDANGDYLYGEGEHTIRVTAEDPIASAGGPVADHTTEKTFTVVVDRTEPIGYTGGDLQRAEDVARFVNTGSDPDLTVDARDSNEAGTPTAGIKSIEVKLDGVDSSPATQRVEQTCATAGCGMEHTFDLDIASLANGEHTANLVITDLAGNVGEQDWTFTVDRASALPSCQDPGVDFEACDPEEQSTAAPACLPEYVQPQEAAGTSISASIAAELTDKAEPDARDPSQEASEENLTLQPSIESDAAGYVSDQTVQTSTLGASVPTYTLGAGTEAVCVAPASTTTEQSGPVANGTTTEYANTAASTDTLLRPVPSGVEQITQIRDDAAPETIPYQITPHPGRYLDQLSDGSIALIDTSRPTLSSILGPYDTSNDPPPEAGPGSLDDDTEPALGPRTDPEIDLSASIPEPNDVPPPDTEAHYESDLRMLSAADAKADGQAIAVFTPPTVTDDAGATVPAELSLSGPNAFTLQVHYRGGSHHFPIIAKTKAAHVRPLGVDHYGYRDLHHYGAYGLDDQVLYVGGSEATDSPSTATNGLNVTVSPPDSRSGHHPAEGGPALRAGLHAKWTRTNLYGPRSCEPWANDEDRATVNRNGGILGTMGAPIKNSHAYNILKTDETLPPSTPTKLRARYCRAAAEFVKHATDLHMTPYVTIDPWPTGKEGDPTDVRPKNPANYVAAVTRLWKTEPFKDTVKWWGATNEPDEFLKKDGNGHFGVDYAVKIYRDLDRLRQKPSSGCRGCHIMAGEFAGTVQFEKDYIQALRGTYVPYWAVHDHWDFSHPDAPGGPYGTMNGYLKHLKMKVNGKGVGFKNAKLLVSEVGIPLWVDDQRTPVEGSRARQITAANRWLNLNTLAPNTLLVSYYQMFGQHPDWDSALVTPQGASVELNNQGFRTAYCVFTKRPGEIGDAPRLCPETTHHVPATKPPP